MFIRACEGYGSIAAASRATCPRPWLQTRRIANSSTVRRNDTTSPFPGYEIDALDAPLHRPYADPSPEDLYPMTIEEAKKQEEDSTVARAKRVFGDRERDALERKRLAESQSRLVAGVLVPPKPEEPDNCCMSGCVNCVWERFREELEEYALKMQEAKTAQNVRRLQGQATGLMSAEPGAPNHKASSMDDDGGGSETLWNDAVVPEQVAGVIEGGAGAGAGGVDDDDPFAGVPIGIREFMKTEKKLKESHKKRGEKMETALDTELRPAAWSTSTRATNASPR